MQNVTRREMIGGTAAAGLVGVFASGAALEAKEKGDKAAVMLDGKWNYQSYRPDPGSIAADPKNPTFVRFSPPGVVTIEQGGTRGELVFPGTEIKLGLEIHVTDGNPARVSISAVMNLNRSRTEKFTNELQGWLVPARLGQEVGKDNPLVVRGSIVQTSKDIVPKDKNPQPIYTTGFFVLEPMK